MFAEEVAAVKAGVCFFRFVHGVFSFSFCRTPTAVLIWQELKLRFPPVYGAIVGHIVEFPFQISQPTQSKVR